MEDEDLKMIPTSYRTKIPQALSYTCGAKMLSLAWQDVPQFDLFDLQFPCDVTRALHGTIGWRHLLAIELGQWRPAQIPRFREIREDGKWMWNISVSVCLHHDAHEVRQWLQDTGLQLARSWLKNEAHRQGQTVWRAFFDEETRAFDVQHG